MSELNHQLQEQLANIDNVVQEAYQSFIETKNQGSKRLLNGTLWLAAITVPVTIAGFIFFKKS